MSDEAADVAADVEKAELRALVRDALGGLGPAEREVLELQLRQDLGIGEVSSVFGISRNHAHALLSRARSQLAAALGVLIVARAGRRDCPDLDTLLQDWDGRLTTFLRKRVNRHVERCLVCSGRRRRELTPAMLLGAAPFAAPPWRSGTRCCEPLSESHPLRWRTGRRLRGLRTRSAAMVPQDPPSAPGTVVASAAGARRRGGGHRGRGHGRRRHRGRAAPP
jgi:Sigma-70, region 4